jgi:hypothetical protein
MLQDLAVRHYHLVMKNESAMELFQTSSLGTGAAELQNLGFRDMSFPFRAIICSAKGGNMLNSLSLKLHVIDLDVFHNFRFVNTTGTTFALLLAYIQITFYPSPDYLYGKSCCLKQT